MTKRLEASVQPEHDGTLLAVLIKSGDHCVYLIQRLTFIINYVKGTKSQKLMLKGLLKTSTPNTPKS